MMLSRHPALLRITRAYQRRFAARALILMYHRVARPFADPWRLSVSPENFASHLDMLKRSGVDVVPVALLPERLKASRHGKCISITFDDGYQDNLEAAAPMLFSADLPATLFAATGFIGGNEAFWWDRLASIFLRPGYLPSKIEVEAASVRHSWDLGQSAEYSQSAAIEHQAWKARHPAPTRRHAIFIEAWQVLVKLGDAERDGVLQQLEALCESDPGDDQLAMPMSRAGLRQFSQIKGMSVGAHGHSHRSLQGLCEDALVDELTRSKTNVEQITGVMADTISYPQGMYDERTVAAARKAGFRIGLTVESRAVTASPDLLRLPRINVADMTGADLAGRLRYFMAFR